MPRKHIVQQGECFSSLALQYGFRDGQSLYDQQDGDLKSSRDLNVLMPGDEVTIPDPAKNTVTLATNQVHRFKVYRERVQLRLLIDTDDKTYGYELHVGDEVFTGTTDGSSPIEHPIPLTEREARLITWLSEEGGSAEEAAHTTTWTLQLGELDPVSEVHGLQQRLQNLGLYCGPINGELNGETVAGLRELQERLGLEVTGEYDETTQAQLQGHHDED